MTAPAPNPTVPEPTPAPPVTDEAPVAQDTPPAAPKPPQSEQDPWADPEAARKEIERLRRENASDRTKAKENAADAARAELAQQVGRALGLVTDDEPVDPAKLTDQLTASQADAKQARVDLAVYQASLAPDVNADPAALLDSVTFRAKVATLDPTDSAAITAAIGEAVAANPRLARSQQPGRMAPNRAQGSSAAPPLGIKERIAQAQTEGDTRTAMLLKASMALNSQN